MGPRGASSAPIAIAVPYTRPIDQRRRPTGPGSPEPLIPVEPADGGSVRRARTDAGGIRGLDRRLSALVRHGGPVYQPTCEKTGARSSGHAVSNSGS